MNDKQPALIDSASKAATLSAALPYFRRYSGKSVVVKYGGHAMGDTMVAELFARDVVLLKQVGVNPIVVHGGGPQIGQMLERLKIKSSFIDGLRVTDRETVEIVEMVLSGSINKEIVSAINKVGGLAIGLSGKDADLIRARKFERKGQASDSNIEKVLDLGFVGEPYAIDAEVLTLFERSNIIPVIAPIGVGPARETYNINADTVAGAVAAAVRAARLLLLTDVKGVLDKEKKLVSRTHRRRGARAHRRRHHPGRDDPEDRDLHPGGRGRRRGRGHPRRPDAARGALGAVLRRRRRHAHPAQRQGEAARRQGREFLEIRAQSLGNGPCACRR